jgi:methylmalonyl-CoA/ethylmalonyl-CoA epimerase
MFGLVMHHVGIACKDMESTAEFVLRSYVVESDTGKVYDPLQDAYLRLFNGGRPGAIELVSGPMVANMAKQNITYFHVCYSTPNLEKTLADSQEAGAMIVSAPKPAILFGGRLVAFIYTPLGLVELLEETNPAASSS